MIYFNCPSGYRIAGPSDMSISSKNKPLRCRQHQGGFLVRLAVYVSNELKSQIRPVHSSTFPNTFPKQMISPSFFMGLYLGL